VVAVPSLLFLELLNVPGRRWGWDEADVHERAEAPQTLGFDVGEDELGSVAAWVARSLPAYAAASLPLAEVRGIRLISDDDQILEVAASVASP